MAFPLFIFAWYCTSWLPVLWPSREHALKLRSELRLYTDCLDSHLKTNLIL